MLTRTNGSSPCTSPSTSCSTNDSATWIIRAMILRNFGWLNTRKPRNTSFRNSSRPSTVAASPFGKEPQIARYAMVPNGAATNSPIITISSTNAARAITSDQSSHRNDTTRVATPWIRPYSRWLSRKLRPSIATLNSRNPSTSTR